MMSVKELIKKIILKEKYDSKSYISFLRKKGVQIGEGCIFYVPQKTFVDLQYPWMITIGSHVFITKGVNIICHDYSWSVLKRLEDSKNNSFIPGAILGASGEVKIGNNVFIGMDATITRNVIIGDNVIIGAGSVVTKNCESNSVYAGNPAKRVCSVYEFYEKRKNNQEVEAKKLVKKYKERFGTWPEANVLFEYFMLFESLDSIKNNSLFVSQLNLCENGYQSQKYLELNNPKYKSFDDFLESCAENE